MSALCKGGIVTGPQQAGRPGSGSQLRRASLAVLALDGPGRLKLFEIKKETSTQKFTLSIAEDFVLQILRSIISEGGWVESANPQKVLAFFEFGDPQR